MKHVPIGTIKQKKGIINNTLSYSVSLFNGRIRRNFETLNEAKTFSEVHIRSMLVEQEITALCVKYKRLDGYSSYIMYDFIWNEAKADQNTANEFEETEFEYLNHHMWYQPYWKKATKVNERSYSAGDVLRASMARTPFAIYSILFLSVALFLLMIIGVFVSFYNFNEYLSSNRWYINVLLVLTTFVLVGGIFYTVRPYVRMAKKIKKHERDFNEVDWKEVFIESKKSSWIASSLIITNIIISLVILLLSHLHDFANVDAESVVKKILVGQVIVHTIRLLLLVTTRLYIYWKISKFVKHLFAEAEWPQFKAWLKETDPIWEFRTSADFFIIPHEYSLDFVQKEKLIIDKIIRTSDDDELKDYGKKAIKHYKVSVKKHLNILKGKYVNF